MHQPALDAHANAQPKECHLCGLPLRRSVFRDVVEGKGLDFCCPGCRGVFQILSSMPDGPPSDFKATELFRECVASGLIPRNEQELAEMQDAGAETRQAGSEAARFDDMLARELVFQVEGMWCTACSWLLEEVLRKTRGVVDVKVFFLTDIARVKYLPQYLTFKDIQSKISTLGYRASTFQDQSESGKEADELFLRLGISAIFTFNVMMISLALYYGFLQELGTGGVRLLSYPLWALATPVIFYTGLPIIKRAVAGVRLKSMTMDTLIAVGALSAYFYSVIQLRSGSLHLYFDTAAMLVTLVLLGKYIELRAREKVSSGITDLYRIAGGKVRLWNDGRERWVRAEAVVAGDEFVVSAGERVPVDGCIVSGRATTDDSILTGESQPVKRREGDELMAGVLLMAGEVRLRSTRSGPDSSINQIISLIQGALAGKNNVELLADRITRWVVPAVFVLAAATAIFLWSRGASSDTALIRAVAVLVITCPCALGIATPLAKVAAVGAGRAAGILVRNPEALEKAKNLDVVVFDKTGTITEGDFSLRSVVVLGTTREEALGRIASVEMHSDHYLAREIVRKARAASLEIEPASDFDLVEGQGVKGSVAGQDTFIGNRALMDAEGLDIPADLDARGAAVESKGATVLFFAWGGAIRGLMEFGDSLKQSSRRVVLRLQAMGVATWLLSGDSNHTTRAIAHELGIDRFIGQALPKDKLEIIRSLQEQGRSVAMVGDGVNDAAALARANVGFALGAGANLIREASDVTLLSDDPECILKMLDLSRTTSRIIRQNLFLAFIYNALGIPLAIAGVLNPVLAVAAMFASSLTVIANSVRISRTLQRNPKGGSVACEEPQDFGYSNMDDGSCREPELKRAASLSESDPFV